MISAFYPMGALVVSLNYRQHARFVDIAALLRVSKGRVSQYTGRRSSECVHGSIRRSLTRGMFDRHGQLSTQSRRTGSGYLERSA